MGRMKSNQPEHANEGALAELHERFAPGLLRFFQRKVSGGGVSSQAYGDRLIGSAERYQHLRCDHHAPATDHNDPDWHEWTVQ